MHYLFIITELKFSDLVFAIEWWSFLHFIHNNEIYKIQFSDFKLLKQQESNHDLYLRDFPAPPPFLQLF